jgi:C4-dicarboxylate-specific signal transduction histidine kinase
MEVHDARMQLLDQSFKAGKADAAAEVMHNIRNAMTPLVNGLDRLAKNFTATTTLRVGQATDELGDPDCEEGRREKLLMYVKSAFAHIQATNEDAVENLAIATKQAHQVEAILADQAKHARVKPILEDFDLGNLIEEAVLVLPKSDDTEVDLLMQPELNNFRVRGHRVGVLQVLGNVMLNAFESIERTDEHRGNIAVSATNETVADKQVIRLTIKDSGCGFDEEVRKDLFRRGFSSKDGHMSGLGLHWCANALANMDGGIQAESSGPGLGAEIHVLLPAA